MARPLLRILHRVKKKKNQLLFLIVGILYVSLLHHQAEVIMCFAGFMLKFLLFFSVLGYAFSL